MPHFWRYPKSRISLKHSLGKVKGYSHAKTSSIRLVVSTKYRLVTDGRTDGQTDRRSHDDSIASRGKKEDADNNLELHEIRVTFVSCLL